MKPFNILQIIVFLFLSRFFYCEEALSGCGKLKISAQNVVISWDEEFTYLQREVLIKRSSSHGNCHFFVTFSKGGASSYCKRRMVMGPEKLRYQLYKSVSFTPRNILKDFPEARFTRHVLRGKMRNKQSSVRKEYFIAIPRGPAIEPYLVKSGRYSDIFIVRVFRGIIPIFSSRPHDTESVIITAIVPRIIRIALVGYGAPFDPDDTHETLDFGVLQKGESRTFDIRVVTNAGFSISFASINNGRLVHFTDGNESEVFYKVKVNGVYKDLSSSQGTPVEVSSGTGETSLEGVRNPVKIKIGSVENKAAGDYSDIITVTAKTIE